MSTSADDAAAQAAAAAVAALIPIVRQVLGPILIGVVTHAILIGVAAGQYLKYFTSGFKDSGWLIATVCWMGLVDVLLTLNSVVLLWYDVIEHFLDATVLQSTPWHFNLTPLFSTFTAMPVQLFLANRIRKFSGSNVLFAALCVLIIGAAVFAWMTSIKFQLANAVADRALLLNLSYAWLGLSVGCDTSLTALMIYYLWRKRTGFERTNKIIFRYVQVSLQSAFPVTICAILLLVLARTKTETNFHWMFTVNLPTLYTLTFLTTLNARTAARNIDTSYSGNSMDLNVMNKRTRPVAPHDVSINVTQTRETHGDRDIEWPVNVKSDPDAHIKSVGIV